MAITTITEKNNNAAKEAVNDFSYVIVTLSDGTEKKITKAQFAAIMAKTGDELDINKGAMDGIFICYKKADESYHRLATIFDWPTLQNGGQVADGVLVTQGDKWLIVAPNCSTSLNWAATQSAVVTGYSTSNKAEALARWEGKTRTATAVAALGSTNIEGKALGYVNSYSHGSIAAGSWWLPSLGELLFIYANKNRINKALALITGANLLPDSAHWSSTERSATNAWILNFGTGLVGYYNKPTISIIARPVAEWPF